MRELFVYYRIAARDASHCEALVHDFQARLMRELPSLHARLLGRPRAEDGVETWMETYAVEGPASSGVDPVLEARIETEARVLTPHLRGPRHVEVFVPRIHG